MQRENRGVAYRNTAFQGGFVMLPWIVMTSPWLSNVSKWVYAGLLHYARQDDAAFPGQDRLGFVLGFSERHVRTGLKQLEAEGLIVIEQRGLGDTNVYWIEPLTDTLCERLHREHPNPNKPCLEPE